MITVKQAAEKWKVTERRVQDLCKRGEIIGAARWGRSWMIPENAPYPEKGKNNVFFGPNLPMPKKTPFLDMTNLYHTPGCYMESLEALSHNREAAALFEAEIAYSRGEIDKVYYHARHFLDNHSGFYAVTSAGMLLALCCMWTGDVDMWKRAKVHITEAPCKTADDHEIVGLVNACIDGAIFSVATYPDWFKKGRFSKLPKDSHPSARVFYAKYLYASAYGLASGKYHLPDVTGLGLMKILPYILEPMITRSEADKTVIPEIYLRLICATAYHNIGDKQSAIEHVDRAIELAEPDGLWGIFAEHRRQLDFVIDERLQEKCPEAIKTVKELSVRLMEGWTKLHNSILNNTLTNQLSSREYEVAKLAAFGFTNQQISDRLNISVASVKQAIRFAMDKTGAANRNELVMYI